MKRRLLAVTLACALLLSACSSDKNDRDERDRDDDDNGSGFTRVVETETEAPTEAPRETRETAITTTVPETEAAPVIDVNAMNAAYLAVLEQYETELRIVEDVEYGAMPSVSLADITGDGVNELIIEYCADQENGWGNGESNYYMTANIKIFTYDPAAGAAVEMHTIQNAVMNAAGGFYTDIIVLNDGTIMIESNGGDEDWSYSYTVFEVQGYSLVQVSELEIYSWPDDDYNYQSEYTYNGEQITEEQSDALIAQYISQMSYAVVWNQYYDSEWYESGDWAETVMSLPSNHISYDEAVAQLS